MESLGLLLVTLPFQLLNSIGYYELFKKAGKPGWLAFIPYWNSVIVNDIIGRPRIEVFLELVPFVNIYVLIRNIVELLRCFGEEGSWSKTFAITFGWLYFPIFAHKKTTKYLGVITSLPKQEKPKSIAREWADAIVFAVVAATLIRWLIMEAYTIPTPSMENSMLVGDFLFVSKFHYGTRTPRTPIQMPLTHQKIWFTNIPSYADWIQLPSYRLPGFTHVKRNDVVVFNVPRIEENNYGNYNRNTWIDYPVDLKTNYIKRCVAEAGDVLEIRNRQLIVNGSPFENPEGLRFQYLVESTNDINVRNIEKLGLDGDDYSNAGRSNPDKPNAVYYTMFLTEKQKELVKAESYIKSVELYEGGEAPRFPFSKYTASWTGNNYGPLTIPKEGMKIAINDSTLSIYGTTIVDYDLNKSAEIKDGKLTIDGKEVTEYTFNQNYYFMMGDNRDNSLDSRYWGFVPEDHVVGKGFFIWLSIDKYGSFLDKIRWNRFFKPVR